MEARSFGSGPGAADTIPPVSLDGRAVMLTRPEVNGFKNLIDFALDSGPYTCADPRPAVGAGPPGGGSAGAATGPGGPG